MCRPYRANTTMIVSTALLLRGPLARLCAGLLIALAAPVLPIPLGAQRVSRVSLPRFEIGGVLEYARPVGQFSQNVQRGFGGGGHFILGLDPARVLGLRIDADFVNYGKERQFFVVSSPFDRVELQEETSNNIFVATVGPQIMVPVGPVRPYVNGGIGIAYFYTETSLKGTYDPTTFAQTTNFSDNSLAYTGSVGVYIPFEVQRQSAALDIGARYNAIGTTRYLTKGDIVDDPDNPNALIITPRESDARFLTYRVGLAVKF